VCRFQELFSSQGYFPTAPIIFRRACVHGCGPTSATIVIVIVIVVICDGDGDGDALVMAEAVTAEVLGTGLRRRAQKDYSRTGLLIPLVHAEIQRKPNWISSQHLLPASAWCNT